MIINKLSLEKGEVHRLNHPEEKFRFSKGYHSVSVDLNFQNSNKLPKVFVFDCQGILGLKSSNLVKPSCKDQYNLTSGNAENYYSYSGQDYYSNKHVVVKKEWCLSNVKPGHYQIRLVYTLHSVNRALKLCIDSAEFTINQKN